MSRSLLAGVTRRSMRMAAAFARPVTEAAMNTTVLLARPSDEVVFDRELRESVPADPATYYVGPAGITTLSGPVTMDLGDEPAYFSTVQVYLPQDASSVHPRIDDLIEIISTPDDDAIGRWFRVTDVEIGGRMAASLRLSAIGIAPSKQWSQVSQ